MSRSLIRDTIRPTKIMSNRPTESELVSKRCGANISLAVEERGLRNTKASRRDGQPAMSPVQERGISAKPRCS